MIYSIVTFGFAMWLAWWLLVFTLWVALYRALQLPALGWIGVYYAIWIVAFVIREYYGYRISESGYGPEHSSAGRLAADYIRSPFSIATCIQATLEYAGDLLVLVLAFSEAAVLVRRVHPDVRSWVLQTLTAAHRRTRVLGIAAIIVTALLPVPWLIYFYTRG